MRDSAQLNFDTDTTAAAAAAAASTANQPEAKMLRYHPSVEQILDALMG